MLALAFFIFLLTLHNQSDILRNMKNAIKRSIIAELESRMKHFCGANWKQDACPEDYDSASLDNKIAFLQEAVAGYEAEEEVA